MMEEGGERERRGKRKEIKEGTEGGRHGTPNGAARHS